MARESTPGSRKRGRASNGANEDAQLASSSAKKRRLKHTDTSSSQPAPGALHAIASAISGAFGFGGRASSSSLQREKEMDKTYEVPDSDEEKVRAETRVPERKTPSRKPGRSSKNIYDVPDSGNERGTTPTSKGARGRPRGVAKNDGINGTSQKGSGRQRTGRARRGVREDSDGDTPIGTDTVESPTKLPSSRGSRTATSDEQVHNALETSDADGPKEATPLATKGSGRKKRNALDDLVIDGTPKLKGILTPSRKDKDGDRPRKNVAFEGGGGGGTEEVYFADLPSKAAKPKQVPKKVPKKVPETPMAGTEAAGEDAEEDDEAEADEENEDEDEEDEVCVVCSNPDSEPPNEIIFCDNCDMAVHQKCYGVAVIPEGDWLCRGCAQEDVASSAAPKGDSRGTMAVEDRAPDIPNLGQHLRSLQRVLLDRCTGRRAIKLRGQDEAYEKTFQLVEQTVVAGEGNSMLVIGARGCGKTAMVESIVSSLSSSEKDQFYVVRLNGFIHTDDKLALKEIWRQLGKEMEVEDDVVSRTSNYADTLASLLAVLSHPSEISGSESGTTSKSVVFVIDEFDLFATHARQTLLYNLFDIAQARKAPIAVLGLTTRIDVVESLEKRVKSRFSHRYVYLSLPKSLPAYWDICRQGLVVEEGDMEEEGLDTELKGHGQFHGWWNKKIETLRKDAAFEAHLEFHFYGSKSVAAFLTTCILPLASLSPTSPGLKMPSGGAGPGVSLEAPDSKLHLLASLSDLDLGLLIAAARLDIVAHTDTVNFAMAYDEYSTLMGKVRVQSAGAGMLALGGGSRVWGRGVAGMAWERLVTLGLLVPAGLGGGRGISGHGGLEARMWKIDVALEEIPTAVKLSTVLAKWCKEI